MKNKDELNRKVTSAIIDGALPEEALEWDLVEEIHTLIIRGGGEKTSWHPHVLIRHNGKQIWRNKEWMFDYEKPLEKLFGDRLIKVGDLRKGTLYVLQPEKKIDSTEKKG